MAMPLASESGGSELGTLTAPSSPNGSSGARPQAYLSMLPAGVRERGWAFATIMASAAIFAMAIPYAKVPLLKVPAFIPVYESALLINEAITALFLLGQFVQLRSRGLLLLSCAYLFEALLIIPHALTFPGLFAEAGLLGAGPQSTAWLYMFWHAGFPVLVIAYAWISARNGKPKGHSLGIADVVIAYAGTIAAAVLLTLLATSWKVLLPAIMDGNGYTPVMKFVVATVWLMNALALFAVWRKPRRSALDLWLMVVCCAWIFDIGLSAVFNAGRFDLGFYVGRIYGLLAASFVLGVLLLETSGLYSRLALSATALRARTRRLEADVAERITEQAKTEEQLRHAQKMEAIGNLTGGMAHDFNNLLGVIIGNLDALCEKRPDDREIQERAGAAIEAATRGADLTRRLLAFARRQPLKPERIDVNELVSGITRLLGRTLGEAVEIEFKPGTGVWPVVVDPAQLQSSIANLATNARDAMPNGGRIVVSTGNGQLDRDYAAQHADVVAGDYAIVEVRDTGTGMPTEVLARIFEPFFTTKEEGKGTGLGLAMVYGFIKQSKGHINVYSEIGIGTVFRLYLPRAMGQPAATAAARAEAAPTAHGETVLAVEDNAALRDVLKHQLAALGYRTLEASDATAALAVLERQPVDLLLTDVVMPGKISGIDLARQVRARWPRTRILFTSGFPDVKTDTGSSDLAEPMLSKPYRREDLARALRQVFDRQ